ncbi:MAG: hybrid sensor histidine kinase/response regulator [Candidatus Riflebacteria bacterium]|nr:hybrid sensor histidine kinase/response regulator [Candidatus Riflebacteria bacterium]
MAIDLSKFMGRFITESREHIEKLNQCMVNLEKNPDDLDLLNAAFRSAHSVKGLARMLKFVPISETAHKLEDILDALRQKKLHFSSSLSDLLFKGIDAIGEMVEKTAAGEKLTEKDATLCAELESAVKTDSQPNQSSAPANDEPEVDGRSEKFHEIPVSENVISHHEPRASGTKVVSDTIRVSSEKLDDLIKLVGEIISEQSRLRHRASNARELEKAAKALHNAFLKNHLSTVSSGMAGAEASVLLGSCQELYSLARQMAREIKNDERLQEILTGQIQERALRMRMLPLDTIFSLFDRTARDLASEFGKKVNFCYSGENTELDKKIIEKLGDPLLHMIRNSIDHGIETPAERVKAGKPQIGLLSIHADYEGGSVTIEVSDDGRGIALDKIKAKALKADLCSEKDLQTMPEAEIMKFIFAPGISTSEIITDVSGRGVGMDVVKSSIVEELKGTIEIKSVEGRGTTFLLRLPLSLAIVRGLIVRAGGQSMVIPSSFAKEVLKVNLSGIIDIVDRKAIRLREQLVPITDLAALLGFKTDSNKFSADSLILVVYSGGDSLGLLVDAIIDEEDLVIKPLPKLLAKVKLVSGIAILGGGEIVNVLQIPEIMSTAKEGVTLKPKTSLSSRPARELNILVVDDSLNTREIEKSILNAHGYHVTLAEDGQDGLEKATKNQFDVIITDIEMPRMDGFSLTEKLRMTHEYRETPIILISSRNQDSDKRRGIQAGANAYIIKGSFDQTSLIDTIQSLTR